MGTHLSTQEDLFVSQAWTALLEEAMVADVEDAANDDSDANSASSGRHAKKQRDSAFRMSFNEWQAFLSILEAGSKGPTPGSGAKPEALLAELQRAASAPSMICHQLSAVQLHCPLVVLTVHTFALWVGALDDVTFAARLERLEELVVADEAGEVLERLESGSEVVTSSESDAVDEGDSVAHRPAGSLPEEAAEEVEPSTGAVAGSNDGENLKSRPARLLKALKSRVSVKRSDANAKDGRKGRTLFLLEEYVELEYLLRNLANERISRRGQGAPANSSTHPPSAVAQPYWAASSARMRTAFRRLRLPTSSSTTAADHSPVARVALNVCLALYAALTPTPVYAIDGIAQLRLLDHTMSKGKQAIDAASRARQDQQSGRPGRTDEKTDRHKNAADEQASVTTQWPWVALVERALVHKQHELDVEQCLGEDGVQLANNLRVIRENRQRSTDAEGPNGEAGTAATVAARFASMAPAKRWDYCMSQYIGQRHIWGPLSSHFLSADVFDADKPTVVVLFGPSGYGKSEMAKLVASALHGCPVRGLEASGKMVYLHMPSFTTKESIYSLVDPPAAHVGDGILLSALHQHPDAVVVLDEFEKSTAEAVQNIWLSAFQKHGVLRSLKRADRSVSTVKTTFILTCNIAADAIEQDTSAYLAAQPARQAQMRRHYEELCKDACRVTLGDPFVNRVDSFYAFTPYTVEERQSYVELTLERLLAGQERKGRRVYVTPRCVAALVAKLKTFHASTIEEVLRPLLLSMSQRRCAEAVLTVEAKALAKEGEGGSCTTYVLLPCSSGPCDSNGEDSDDKTETDTWEALPGGKACLRMWRDLERPQEHSVTPNSSESAANARHQQRSEQKQGLEGDSARSATGESAEAASLDTEGKGQQRAAAREEVAHQLQVELERLDKDTEKLTTRELALTHELELARQLLVQKDVEIATLKERVLVLERLLAVMMCVVLCCSMALYLLVGVKLTLLLMACVTGFVTLVLNIPLKLVLDALAAFFRFLGPVKSALVVLFMSAWVMQASKGLRCG